MIVPFFTRHRRLGAGAIFLIHLVACSSESSQPEPATDTRPLPDVGCDYTTVLGKSCAIAGCHTGAEPIGDLDLRPNQGLRSRLYNVKATHADIDCSTDPNEFVECVPATCPNAKLVDSAAPDNSWILKKLGGAPDMCGDAMPMPPGDAASTGWGATAESCLEMFARALAAGK